MRLTLAFWFSAHLERWLAMSRLARVHQGGDMRSKSLILLALAGGCGIVASIGISQVLDGQGKSPPLETESIYVALHNINLGDPIDASMVSLLRCVAQIQSRTALDPDYAANMGRKSFRSMS